MYSQVLFKYVYIYIYVYIYNTALIIYRICILYRHMLDIYKNQTVVGS